MTFRRTTSGGAAAEAGVTDHGELDGLTDPDHSIAAVTGLQTALDAKIAASLLDANTFVGAVVDNTPVAIPIAANRVVGRKATGDLTTLTPAETRTVLGVGVHLAFGDSAGDESTTSTTAVALTGLTWPSIPAAVDDILEIELIANWYVGTAGNIFVRFDLGGTDGREHMLEMSSTRPEVHIVKEYRQVTSGMISGGLVAVTADWWRGSTSGTAFMENDTTRTIPTLAITNRGAPLA